MFCTVTHIAITDILMGKSLHSSYIISWDGGGIPGVKENVLLRPIRHMVKLPSRKVVETVILGCSVDFYLCEYQKVFVNVLNSLIQCQLLPPAYHNCN